MARLHLIGFTQDLKGLVFASRRNAKKASHWVAVDDVFVESVEKLEKARKEKKASRGSGRARSGTKTSTERRPVEDVNKRLFPAVGRSSASSGMSASEIQQLLRRGRSVKSVAEVAKTSRAWVERLAEPVMEERLGVVRLAQRATMHRARLGRSGLPVGEAVMRNLAERKATPDTLETLDEAWDARATAGGTWKVSLRFTHRGKRRNADWDFRKNTREITARNRLAAQLGWWEPEPEPEPEPAEEKEGDEEKQEAEVRSPPRRSKPAARRRRPKAVRRKPKPKPKAAKRRKPATRRRAKPKASRRRR